MEFQINRKFIIVVFVILVSLFAGVAIVVWPSGNSNNSSPNSSVGTRSLTLPATENESTASNAPEEATVAFAKAFYTVDYQNYDIWLAGLKSASTDDGYAILTKSIAPAVWPEIEKAKTVTPSEAVDATDTGLVMDGASKIGGPWQIRTTKIHVDSEHLWPTMKSGDFEALIMLAKQDGQWLFVSFTTPEQVDQIKKGQRP